MLTMAAMPMNSRSTAVMRVSETGKSALRVNQPVRGHRLSLFAQMKHELEVIDDAADQHQNAERDQRHAEIAGRRAMRDDVLVAQLFEYLKDREAERRSATARCG